MSEESKEPAYNLGKSAGNRGMGRPVGVPNKITKQLKDMILEALNNAGGVDYLTTQAHENPKAFLPLLAKILPYQVTGEGGKPISLILGREDANL